MRKLIIKPHVEASVFKVATWIASQYFAETGLKFIDDLEQFLLKHCALNSLQYPLCKSTRLAKRKFSCLIYKRKWVIAFRYSKTTFTVYEFIWGAKLK
jgi:hypothetical protein